MRGKSNAAANSIAEAPYVFAVLIFERLIIEVIRFGGAVPWEREKKAY